MDYPVATTPVHSPQQSATPSLVFCPHPLVAGSGRELIYKPFVKGESLAQYIERLGLLLGGQAWALHLDDKLIHREHWSSTYPQHGQVVTLRACVKGGGGNDSNKTLRTILAVVVLVVAWWNPLGWSAAGVLLFSAAGTLAAAALFPPVLPPVNDMRGVEDSPTYSISNGSNRARPFEPMPCVLGAHRVFPDYGAKTYTEFQGNDQYLYQVFHFGLTDITLSDYRIGDTPITDYADYNLQESVDGVLTLFPANVDSQAGAALTFGAGWISRTSSPDATALAIELSGFLFHSGDNGLGPLSVTIGIEYRMVGDVTWLPFVAGGEVIITHSSRQPLRWGQRIDVISGQYEIRVRRVTADEWDNRATSEITWTQLRTYQPDIADYTGQTRVAIAIRANEQLQGQIQQLSALATLHCEVWNGSAWVTQATSNPAWLYRYWARGKFIGGRRVFGGGMTDAGLDIAAIQEWGAWCDSKGLTCNLVFDRAMSTEQQLIIIARCGRANPSRASGKLGIIWDGANQPAVASFGMSNIRRGTFRVDYAPRREYNEVALNFVNPDLNWQPDTVRSLVPGEVVPENTQTLELMGCTDAVMAGREANLLAAEGIYRRRAITWETDMEGLVATRGDVVNLSHDLTQWGYSGRLMSGSNNQLTLDRDVPFTVGFDHFVRLVYPNGTEDIFPVLYQVGESATIDLSRLIVKDVWTVSTTQALDDERQPTTHNGYFYVCTVAGTTDALEPVWPLTEGDSVVDGSVTWRNAGPAQQYTPGNNPNHQPMDYKWCFEPQATPGKKVKIVDVQPLDEFYIRLTAVDEEDDYYLSESNTYTHVPITPEATTPTLSRLEVSDTLINVGNSYGVRITVAWDVVGPYGFAIVRAAPAGEPLQVIDRTFDNRSEFLWNYVGFVDIEVTVLSSNGVYSDAGKKSTTYEIVGQDRNPDDVTNFRLEINSNGPVLRWSDVNAADLMDYEIRTGIDWDTGSVIGRVDSNEFPLDWLPAGDHSFLIKARDASTPRNYSNNAATLAVTIVGANPPEISSSFEGENLVLQWAATPGTLPIAEFQVSHGATAGETPVATVSADRFRIRAEWLGTRTWWVVPIDVAGNTGSASSIDVTVLAPSVTAVTRKVIDNQVALQWIANPGTLPIKEYTIYKGDVFATAEFLGTKTGTFDLIVELSGGTYTYWVVPVDVAENAGTEVSTVALVNAPPDFVLREDWRSDYSGARTNAYITQAGNLLVPVNTTETWADHFVNNGWTTPQNQIDAGYPYYAMPSLATAVYEEVFDYGTALEGTLITVIRNMQTIAGSVAVTTTISTRLLDTDSWTDYVGTEQIFATDFRYVKVRLDFSVAAGNDLAQIIQLNVQLSVKQITDEGHAVANAADTGGTVVLLNKPFVACEAINVTPHGSSAITAVIDFPNGANPTQFSVYLFNSATGVRVSGEFSWNARGN